MEIVHRVLNENDLAAYRKIRLECLKSHPENFGATYEEESTSNSLLLNKILATKETAEFVMGVFCEKELIGICGLRQEGRLTTGHIGEIDQMYVSESFSGKGIGKKLLEATLTKVFDNPAIDLVTLGVVSQNRSAVVLYENFGFTQYGRLENSFKRNGISSTQLLMLLTRQKFLDNKA